MNENIGEIECPFCHASSRVRKNVKGKFYFSCPDCGLIQGTGRTFLDWVAEHAVIYTDGAPPPKEADMPKEAGKDERPQREAKAPEPAIRPAPAKRPRINLDPDLL